MRRFHPGAFAPVSASSPPPSAGEPVLQAQLTRLGDAWIDASAQGLIFVREGSLVVATREFVLNLGPGALLIHDGREPLRLRGGTGQAATLLRVTGRAALRVPGREADPASAATLLPILHDPDSEAAQVMTSLAQSLESEAGSHAADAVPAIERALRRLAFVQRDCLAAIERCSGRSPARRRDQFARLARARAVLAWSEGEPRDIARLAEIARLSTAHFVRLFHRVFDVPPHRYRIERRMLVAYRMIRHTPLPVSEIVRRLGLGSHSTFSRTFRRHFGVSATGLRAGAGTTTPVLPAVHA